jgi:multiple sugar transport system substrate-binding protein
MFLTSQGGGWTMRLKGLGRVLATAAVGIAALADGGASARADMVFLSNQLRPVEEAQKVRNVILKGFPDAVDFVPEDPGPFVNRIRAEARSGTVSVGLVGGQHGDLAAVAEHLEPVDDLMQKLAGRNFAASFVELSRLGTGSHLYVPWMQATYIMAANRKALEHLPQGADLDSLTYAQLAAWGANIEKATGERKLGFPAGPKGLMHRFFEGYLYPSYTGGVVRTFKSPDAQTMWSEFAALWKHVNPRSTSYDFMQEPLLAEEVWVAFDHTARLMNALREKPDQFVAFPAPLGPKGRGFMPVIAGLSIPKGTPDRAASARLIEHLTSPEVQVLTLREVAFYPVVEVELPSGDLPEGVRMAGEAIRKQAQAADSLPSLLPVGLGAKNGEFDKVYRDTFQRIVIRGQDPADALETEGKKLASILEETKAPCWQPDRPSDGPCPVE